MSRWIANGENVLLLEAIAVNSEGYRECLGIVEGAKEDEAGWSGFLKHLKERGLCGVQLIISDACMGLAESAAEFFPEVAWQRSFVHFYRNVSSHVPRPKMLRSAADASGRAGRGGGRGDACLLRLSRGAV